MTKSKSKRLTRQNREAYASVARRAVASLDKAASMGRRFPKSKPSKLLAVEPRAHEITRR